MGKQLVNAKPDAFGHYGWKQKVYGCSLCGKHDAHGFDGIFYSGFDQDFAYCLDCAVLDGAKEAASSAPSQ